MYLHGPSQYKFWAAWHVFLSFLFMGVNWLLSCSMFIASAVVENLESQSSENIFSSAISPTHPIRVANQSSYMSVYASLLMLISSSCNSIFCAVFWLFCLTILPKSVADHLCCGLELELDYQHFSPWWDACDT